MPEWDSVRQQKKRILFEIPHLHFSYKSKDLEHCCLRRGRQKEGKREEECEQHREGWSEREREEIVKAIAVAASGWHK